MKLNFTLEMLRNVYTKILLLLLCFGFQQAKAQNSCETALLVTTGITTVGEINGAGNSPCSQNAGNAEWYKYIPTQNYSVTITTDLTENICKDTSFNVYTGNCSGLTCYSGDDDSGDLACNNGNNTFTYLSKKTFDVFAGTTYYIVWDNRWDNSEGFIFQLTEAPFIPSPCFNAIPITAGTTTVNAIDGTNVTTSCSNTSLAKWYSYTPTQHYKVTISSDLMVNICKDTRFSVYTGSCSGTLTCVTSDDNSGTIACNSGNTNSNLSKKTFEVFPGTKYYIVWDNRWSAAGFDFKLSEELIVVPVNYTTQSISTVNSQFNICVADMNGDGKDDIVGVSNNNLRIHYQGDGGTFTITDFTVPGPSLMPDWSIAAGDYNKDGFNDLLLGNTNGVTFWKSNSTGTAYTSHKPGQYIFCQRTNFVDINNDGNLDAFSCHDIDPNVYYINQGGSNADFTYYQSGVTPGAYMLGIIPSGGNYASLWTDFDNDGDLDLFISKCSGPACELHRNDGNGVFTDISAQAQINVTPVSSWSSAVADFDNDGDMDILIGSNGDVRSMLFRNNLDKTNNVEEPYTNITAGSGWDTDTSMNRDYIAYDFDNDGFVDVMGSGNKIMFNKGNGVFEPTNYASMSVGAVGDLNDDGFLDILTGSTIRYGIPNNNNWMKIVLKGVESNSNGIGARIEITGAFGSKIRDVRSGEGFEFMSTINTHFGIGTADSVTKLTITWPSGIVDEILNPTINKTIKVVESSTLSIDDKTNTAFSLYPNPTSDYLHFTFPSNDSQIISAEVFDIAGKKVASPEVKNKSIDIRSLPTGTYIVLLKNEIGKPYSKKFLKK